MTDPANGTADGARYIGLMSGTSVDSIDAALVDLSGATARLQASHSEPSAAGTGEYRRVATPLAPTSRISWQSSTGSGARAARSARAVTGSCESSGGASIVAMYSSSVLASRFSGIPTWWQ